MKRLACRILITLALLAAVGGCGEPAAVEGKATVTEPPKTHKTHSPPPVGTTRNQ